MATRPETLCDKLLNFQACYSRLANTEARKGATAHFAELCKELLKTPKDQTSWEKAAEIYLGLIPASQNELQNRLAAFCGKMHRAVTWLLIHKSLKNQGGGSPYFSPLLLLASRCLPELHPFGPESFLTQQKTTPPLYPQIFCAIRNDSGKLLFNTAIERRLIGKESKTKARTVLKMGIDRISSNLRKGVCSLENDRFAFACTTTHPLIHDESATLESDPFADDLAYTSDENRCLLSIADGGGKGHLPALTAERVNSYFLEEAFSRPFEQPHQIADLLLASAAATEQRLRKAEAAHATHASAFRIQVGETVYGGVSLLGDCTAFLILEFANGEIAIEKLHPLSKDKPISSNGGSFSSIGDYSSLYACRFELAPTVVHGCILLGTDGLGDNLDPRQTLTPHFSEELGAFLEDESNYYRHHTLEGAVSLTDALSPPPKQKNEELLAKTHAFPSPKALYAYLNENLNLLTGKERDALRGIDPEKLGTWQNAEESKELIALFENATLRKFLSRDMKIFVGSLAEHARLQGKPDDILVAALRLI